MSNPFSNPGKTSGVPWADLNGKLLLIEPKAVKYDIPTMFGDKEAVEADISVVETGDVYQDALIFPGVLIRQTKGLIGERVLGRLSQGEAKRGQEPPWLLHDATEADQELGVEYLNTRNATKLTQPAEQQASAAPF